MSDPVAAPVRRFSHLLAMAEEGRLDDDLSTEMNDLVEALAMAEAEQRGTQKGRITLTFDFKLKDGVIDITADTSVKRPKTARGRSMFWITAQNELTRQNPRQQTLPFRDVTGERPPVRTVVD